MARRNRHPEKEILELMDGSLAASSRQAIEAHLAECDKCASVAAVVGALKNQARFSSGPRPDFTRPESGGPPVLSRDSSAAVPPSGAGAETGQNHPPPTAARGASGRRDLDLKDLLHDARMMTRPMLAPGLAGGQPPPPSGPPDEGSPHPNTRELASFFYGELAPDAAAAAAAHVAVCSDCSSAISLYSDAEAAAAHTGEHGASAVTDMSEESWRLIKDWEENCLADPRPESEALSREMLEKFIEILRDHKDEIEQVAAGPGLSGPVPAGAAQIVPVIVLDSSGAFRGVETFHRLSSRHGLEALQCQAPPDRFNNLPIHALLGAERQYPMVVSGRINRGMAELDYNRLQGSLIRPLGYFIVEN